MKIHSSSLIRAGTGAALVAGFLLLLSLTPLSHTFVGYLLIAGLIFVPIGAGMAYGYYAPGKENMAESAVGGALAGLVAGVLLGIAFGINNLTTTWIQNSFLTGLASGTAVTVLAGALLSALGAILGAIGGILWTFFQR